MLPNLLKCMQRQKKRELKSEEKMIIIINDDTNNIKKPKLFLRDQLLLIAVARRPK